MWSVALASVLSFLPSLFSLLPMSSLSRPTFTAAYAHKRAARSAARLCQNADPVPCVACNGTGSMTFTISTISVEGETPPTQQSISCIHCKDGKVAPLQQMYESLVWCRCRQKNTSGFLHAADGRRVFGNTTYLCEACGFVKQFG